MRKPYFFVAVALLCVQTAAFAQNNAKPVATAPTPAPAARRPQTTPQQQQQPRAQVPRPASFDLTDYGVRIEPEPRLVVMMAALDAAGWDPTPAGQEPTLFRRTVREDQASLDPALRARLRDFFARYKPPAPATAAEAAAPYVSLTYLLGPAPAFDAPPRSDDLPAGVLDVLDFVPLLREFYRQTAMEERLPRYVRMHHEEGNRLRQRTAEMVKEVLTYLHTRPQLTIIERTQTRAPASKDDKKRDAPRPTTTLREKERRFLIVPDLLAAPGAINFRVIGDDYHTILPAGTDPTSSELRRAYIQYVADPLVLRAGRDISAKRLAVKQLLDEQRARNPNVTPDVFLSVARSFVIAAEARIEELARVRALQLSAAARLKSVGTEEAARAVVGREVQAERVRIEDETVARLAEGYERGAVLSFHFAEQLRGLETSGFDISNFFGDMIGAIDAVRETRRLAESAETVKRHRETRERARQESAERMAREAAAAPTVSEGRQALLKGLGEADELLRLGDYARAEEQLRALQKQYPTEPHVYFALARTASRSAEGAFDPALQTQRLGLALQLYQDAIRAASPDTDAALISRAHVASGRILAHLERAADALKEFDAAIRIGAVEGGALREAQAERQKLTPQP
ncbi:MAG TPA: hypothetical protein VF240_21310 [Pyrinomonadaceae bacterium]